VNTNYRDVIQDYLTTVYELQDAIDFIKEHPVILSDDAQPQFKKLQDSDELSQLLSSHLSLIQDLREIIQICQKNHVK
jgi:hypothetical protein